MRASLDEVGLKIAEHQEEAMAARKRLAESTREFKRTPEASTRGVGPLLKQYQEEVDKLTKRAKHGESAFLQVRTSSCLHPTFLPAAVPTAHQGPQSDKAISSMNATALTTAVPKGVRGSQPLLKISRDPIRKIHPQAPA